MPMGYNDRRISYSKSSKPDLLPRSQMAHTFITGKTLLGNETFYHFKDLSCLCSFRKDFTKKKKEGGFFFDVVSMHAVKKNQKLVTVSKISSLFVE